MRTIAAAVMITLAVVAIAEAQIGTDSPFSRRVKVQPFPEGLEWLNTSEPVELESLRGKFVLLDFWTYCCINCMHVLPELKKLEKAYPNELVVIGVHSAKFEGEQQTENIKEAVLRHKIEHPVVNDSRLLLWRRFGVNTWPTLLLIDPQGYAVWGQKGEATFEQLDAVLKKGLAYYKRKGLLEAKPIKFDLEAAEVQPTPLRFPGKVLADETGRRLFIADSNHNRIVVTDLDGKLIETVGAGAVGRADGDCATAQFQQPQGMALDGDSLYVADTENHLIRKVDLKNKRVSTIAGLGYQSRVAPPMDRFSVPLKTPLNSPWALWVHDGDLYIAMAGPHQIWRMSLKRPQTTVHAGNGREDIVDGRLAPRAPYQMGFSSFAQPSGLASDGSWLYVADSEGSSIRAVPFAKRVANAKSQVRTLVGTAHLPSARLFTFGDVDGRGREVRLQHPLGVAYYKGKLYVADTYNNKIKVINPSDGTTRTLVGDKQPGSSDTPPRFNEPAGISAAAGKLYIADTNNHAIRVVDLEESNRVKTLSIAGLKQP